METKIEIKSIYGKVLFAYQAENATIKDALKKAVKENADLSNADLYCADLSNARLSNADLSNADLYCACLSNADLSCADLSNACLSNADLSNVNLSYAKKKETANLPIYCKYRHSIIGDKIQIGCKSKTIKEWDIFFESNKVYSTERNTEDFKQIQAVYEAYKAYLNFLNK